MRYLIICVLACGILSCGAPEKKEHPTPQVQKTATPTKKKTKKAVKKKVPEQKFLPYIDNNNVVKLLTEYGKENNETVVRLTCKFGTIDIKLYENTPLHRANFIHLAKRKYFDETLFYRVSKNFVDQAGNSDQQECQAMRAKIGSYTLPPEFRPENIHKKGAVAMARRYDKNPKKRSSPYEFYIVLGRTWNKKEMRASEREYNVTYTDEQKQFYMTKGGTPYLDNQHTVIGEVISGMDVVYEINKVNVDKSEWPLTDIPIKVEVLR
jgi:peptidyl-prolyl cis-trans isomerase B (cyclophilin B)